MNLRANDNVLVVRGKDRGKTARVQQTFPRDKKVLIEGVNVVMRHTKATSGARQGGIIQKELPMWASNVMLICNHCNRPTKVSNKRLADGTKARACSRCQEVIE